jgi:hypothetical protein
MNRKVLQALTWLMWLALPITASRFWLAWNHLPLRMATHFNINGQPNGWMPRETAFYFALGVTALVIVVFTVISHVAHKTHAPDLFSWSLLGFFYLVVGFVYAGNRGVVQYNLDGERMEIDFWTVLVPAATIALVAIFLGTKRGASLPFAAVIAEESHGSRAWSLLFIALLLVQFAAAVVIPTPPVRIASAILSGLFAVIAVHVWTVSSTSSAAQEWKSAPWVSACGRSQWKTSGSTRRKAGIRCAVTGSAASAIAALTSGATKAFVSRPPTAKFSWDTVNPIASSAIWIR